MPFECLSLISKELEENLQILEKELCDASAFIYQGLQNSGRSEKGVHLLKSLAEHWERICNELEMSNVQDEEEVKELEEEVETFKQHFEELKNTQTETETVLVRNNLLEFSSPASFMNSTTVNNDSFTLAPHQLQTSTPCDFDSDNTVYEPK